MNRSILLASVLALASACAVTTAPHPCGTGFREYQSGITFLRARPERRSLLLFVHTLERNRNATAPAHWTDEVLGDPLSERFDVAVLAYQAPGAKSCAERSWHEIDISTALHKSMPSYTDIVILTDDVDQLRAIRRGMSSLAPDDAKRIREILYFPGIEISGTTEGSCPDPKPVNPAAQASDSTSVLIHCTTISGITAPEENEALTALCDRVYTAVLPPSMTPADGCTDPRYPVVSGFVAGGWERLRQRQAKGES